MERTGKPLAQGWSWPPAGAVRLSGSPEQQSEQRGLVREKVVNVLEVNLELRKHFGAPAT